MTWLMAQDWARPRLYATVLVSPAYSVNFPCWKYLKQLFHYIPCCVPRIIKLVKGGSHNKMEYVNELQNKYWTTEYPYECFDIVFELFYEVDQHHPITRLPFINDTTTITNTYSSIPCYH